MKVAVPKEIVTGERRVALVPETVARLVQSGVEVLVQAGAGEGAYFTDEAYSNAGATVVADAAALWGEADVVLKVQRPVMNGVLVREETDLLRESAALIAFLQPLTNPDLVQRLAARRVTSFSMDAIPRIARAQVMDALSSMSTIAGYKAALLAADTLGKLFPLMMTAAGTLAPAKGLVLGAGVAGLQAVATARRLGAVMQAFDVRPATKEQVQSLGATFIELEHVQEQVEEKSGYAKEMTEETQRRERELIHRHIIEADFAISTALVPGKRAPILITGEMVSGMRPGSVIVDLAAEAGGNCELTEPGTQVVKYGVIIHGPLNLPSSMPTHASQMYSRNISNLFLHLLKDGKLHLDFEDAITQGCCITHEGRVVHGPSQALVKG